MADFTAGPEEGGIGVELGRAVNIVAAAVSVALIAGVGVWGYKLILRDVSGVPVVRAIDGDMRVAPENPGGEIAAHVGLSVNAVPGEGGAAEPEDQLVLAPANAPLEAEDIAVAPSIAGALPEEAGQVVEASATAQGGAPLSAEDVLALADQIAAASTSQPAAEAAPTPEETAAQEGVIAASVPGVRHSLRPFSRPADLQIRAAAPRQSEVTAPAAAAPVEVMQAALPVGTKLVQLGAFDSAEIAAEEWVRIQARFPDFFAEKERVIQEATSGGRRFFRLRAMNFTDLNDARRFCTALAAEGAACIPVVVR